MEKIHTATLLLPWRSRGVVQEKIDTVIQKKKTTTQSSFGSSLNERNTSGIKGGTSADDDEVVQSVCEQHERKSVVVQGGNSLSLQLVQLVWNLQTSYQVYGFLLYNIFNVQLSPCFFFQPCKFKKKKKDS